MKNLRHDKRVMFEKLGMLISNEKLRRVLGKNARNYVREKFDWDVVVKRWEKVLISLEATNT